jgi:hypothetical protein
MASDKEANAERQPWEKEILFGHRWGQHGEEAAEEELARLRPLWDAAQPIDGVGFRVLRGLRY